MDALKISVINSDIIGMMEISPAKEKHQNAQGLGWIVTALFIVGALAGGGIVALPTATAQTNFVPGILLMVVTSAVLCYTSYMLGVGWVILQRRWPEYREHCRKPYPEMGLRAMGSGVKHFVSFCIDLTQFGIAVVFLLLSAKNVHDFLDAVFNIHVSFCIVILVVGIALLPLTFLKSPQDFWWAVIVAMVTTAVAVILIIIGSAMDYSTCNPPRGSNDHFIPTNYLLSLGTYLFSYGGHAAFPTILHDMKKPYHYSQSSVLSFIVVTLIYLPICIVGYETYGDSLQESIINSIQWTPIQQSVNILITIHCILTLTIVFNPLNQEVEEMFKTSQHFGWQRVLVRTCMMLAVVFVAESIPTFGPLLDLVGGSTIALTALVFPCLFYLYLLLGDEMMGEKQDGNVTMPTFKDVIVKTPKLRLIVCCIIMVFGLVGGTAATYAAIRELSTTHFVAPCYVQALSHSVAKKSSPVTHLNCCGKWQNVTRFNDLSNCNPYRDYYGRQ